MPTITANAINSKRSTAPIAFLVACFPSLVRAIRCRRLYHRSFVAFFVVLGIGHNDSLALNKH
jgi:hypothetical protein